MSMVQWRLAQRRVSGRLHHRWDRSIEQWRRICQEKRVIVWWEGPESTKLWVVEIHGLLWEIQCGCKLVAYGPNQTDRKFLKKKTNKKQTWICCQCLKRGRLYISFWSWPAASPFIKGSQLSRVSTWFTCSCYFLDPGDDWVCTHDPDDTLFKVLDCELLTRPGV